MLRLLNNKGRMWLSSLLFVFISTFGYAQKTEKSDRILILLDASISMNQKWSDSMTRYNAASTIINTLIDSVYKRNDEVEFALRAYGHQSPTSNNDCLDTKLEVMFSRDNATQMELRLSSIKPRGISNTAFAIEETVANDMERPDKYNYSIVVLTDGGESCGNSICEVAAKLKTKLTQVCIISLTEYANSKNEYECLGRNITATQQIDINSSVKKLLNTCCNVPYKKRPITKNDESAPQVTKKIITSETTPKAVAKQPVISDTLRVIINRDVAVPTQPAPKKSKIVVVNDEIGYLKLAGNLSLSRITLYQIVDGDYKFYNKQLEQDDQGRIPLPEGSFRMVFTKVGVDIYKDFKIVRGMITEVSL